MIHQHHFVTEVSKAPPVTDPHGLEKFTKAPFLKAERIGEGACSKVYKMTLQSQSPSSASDASPLIYEKVKKNSSLVCCMTMC
jgi:hypothetical protein